jgi:DNA-binding MarR family transcriptional regulator
MGTRRRRGARRARVADRLHSLAIHLLRRVAAADRRAGVTGPRLSVLSVLVLGGGPRTVGALAEAEHVRPPTMTRLVQAMEEEGLVARARSRDDARATIIRATAVGARILRRARSRRLQTLRQLIAGLEAGQLGDVERALRALEPVVSRIEATRR